MICISTIHFALCSNAFTVFQTFDILLLIVPRTLTYSTDNQALFIKPYFFFSFKKMSCISRQVSQRSQYSLSVDKYQEVPSSEFY